MSFAIPYTARQLMLQHGVEAAAFASGMAARLQREHDGAMAGGWLRCAALIRATQDILANTASPAEGVEMPRSQDARETAWRP